MHPNEFERIFTETWSEVAGLASIKSGEYASEADTDRLSNFKDAGKRQHLLPEKALMVYLDKHFAAISNFVEDLVKGKHRPRSESINGRANDLILYAILLKCLLAERGELQDAMTEEVEHEVRTFDGFNRVVEYQPPGPLQWDDEEQ